jgi:hypothetical protein
MRNKIQKLNINEAKALLYENEEVFITNIANNKRYQVQSIANNLVYADVFDVKDRILKQIIIQPAKDSSPTVEFYRRLKK